MKIALVRRILTAGLLLVVFGSLYFVHAQTWKGKIIKEGDITIVQNPKEPLYKGDIVSLKEDLRLGGPEAKGDYSFNQIQTLAVDAQENIFVLDYKESHVKVFDKTGKYLRTIGRKGQGPGELAGPMAMAFDHPSGALLVLEAGAHRISRFDSQGKFFKALPLKSVGGLRMRLDSIGNIFILESVYSEKETHYVIKKFAPDMRLIAILTETPSVIDYAGAIGTNNPFGPRPSFDIDGKDRFLYGFPKLYEIQIFGPANKPVGRILKEYSPVAVTAEEIDEQKKDTPPEIKLDFSKYHAAFRRFFPDDEGHLFVQTFEKTKTPKSYIFDVFDAEGRFMGSMPFADAPVLIKKDKLYSLEEDEDGYQIIKRYVVTWRAGR